jgi:phosphotransferase system HPr (HPr) family protein
MNSVSTELEVKHAAGLHLRPAAMFVQTAASFGADIQVRNVSRGTPFRDAKSALAVMMLGVTQGQVIGLEAQGDDAEAAILAIKDLIENNFGESG